MQLKNTRTDKIKQIAQFKDGKPTGVWEGYDSKGHPLYLMDYDEGRYAVSQTDKNGNVLLDENGHAITKDMGKIRYDGRVVSDRIPDVHIPQDSTIPPPSLLLPSTILFHQL